MNRHVFDRTATAKGQAACSPVRESDSGPNENVQIPAPHVDGSVVGGTASSGSEPEGRQTTAGFSGASPQLRELI